MKVALLHNLKTYLKDEHSAVQELKWMVDKLLSHKIRRLRRDQQQNQELSIRSYLSHLHSNPGQALSASIIAHNCECFDTRDHLILNRWIRDRIENHKPLQYILGTQPFLGIDLLLRPPILIPRWETEEWVEQLAEQVTETFGDVDRRPVRVLDICSGTGCIGLGLLNSMKGRDHALDSSLVGIDINPRAVMLSRVNARRAGLEQQSRFICCDALTNLDNLSDTGEFDVICSNPPYIQSSEYETLDFSVKMWEDKRALLAHEGGMQFYRIILAHAIRLMCGNTRGPSKGTKIIAFEVGEGQAEIVAEMMARAFYRGGFSRHVVQVKNDACGIKRCIVGIINL
jgi:release factor glutamine methyltransferase